MIAARLVLIGLLVAGVTDPLLANEPGSGLCYKSVAEGRSALSVCDPDPVPLAEAVAATVHTEARSSLAETWISMGTRLHDLVIDGSQGISVARCHTRATDKRWQGALVLSKRAILTGLRLVADPRSAPSIGTHAGLFLSRALIHPCAAFDAPAIPSTGGPGGAGAPAGPGSWQAVAPQARRFAQSDNSGYGKDGGLEQAARDARTGGNCAAAVRLSHAAAAAAPDKVGVWYTLQVTMLECGLWDFSPTAPTPEEILHAAPPAGEQAPGACERFAVVSGASHEYFERARNLAGSLRVWDPALPALFYDLGLEPRQTAEARGWAGVELRALDFKGLPKHVRRTGWEHSSYAFKPVVVRDALKTHDCILWLDSGIELRRDVSSWAPRYLSRFGALLVGSGWPFPNAWMHPACAHALLPSGADPLVSLRDARGHFVREVWSGVMGFNRRDPALMRDIVEPMLLCALDPECIAPAGSNKSNHRQDQTVLSLLAYSRARAAEGGDALRYPLVTSARVRAFAPAFFSHLSADEKVPNDVLLFQRRGHAPYPYHPHVAQRSDAAVALE